jgi:trimethylamine---corrinoid protein Co-methyltransferase
MIQGFVRNFKPIEILTDNQVEMIHRGTLEILWQTGIKFEHDKTLKLLESNGCLVDYDKKIAKMPSALVEDCLRKCPSSFTIKARDSKNDIRLGGNYSYFMGGCGLNAVDSKSGETFVPSKKDNDDGVKIMDALETVAALDYGPYHNFIDVPPSMVLTWHIASAIRNSSKVLVSGIHDNSEIWNTELAKITNQEICFWFEPSPPLTYYKDACEGVFNVIKAKMPVFLSSGCTIGASGPSTIAGATVTSNAELIGGIVLVQLICPGTSVSVNNFVAPMNMSNGNIIFGSSEHSLHNAIFNQMWRKYGIPTQIAFYSHAKYINDYQTGYEKGLQMLASALYGANFIQCVGAVFAEMTWNPLTAIMDNDIAGWIGHVLGGSPINDDTLAVDLIKEVGPIPGVFLNKKHTLKHWKNEQYFPKVSDRLSYKEWIETGKRTSSDYAQDYMEEILKNHKPTPLTEEQEIEIEKVLKKAEKFYKDKG